MPLVFKNGTISIYEVRMHPDGSASTSASRREVHSRRGYFLQNAIRCQPSGRTQDRGKALKVPTNIVLNATPFQPL